MGDEDGWGNVVDLLQQHTTKHERRGKKRKGIGHIDGQPLPIWMKNCVFGVDYDAAEYLISLQISLPTVTFDYTKIKATTKKEIAQVPASDGPHSNTTIDKDQKLGLDTVVLDTELLAKLKKALETLQNTSPPFIMPPQFAYLQETPLLSEALTALELFTLQDECIAEISRHFISIKGSSYVQCLSFAKHTLLPKVKGLTTTASRALVGGLNHCAKLHPVPLMHGFLIPLVTDDTGPVQSEVVNRIAFVEKCLSPELCQEFMREILSKKLVWTDPFVVLVTNALNLNIQFTDEIGSLIVTQASKQVDNFATNPKFAKLVLIFITKYPTLAKPHTALLQQILAKCKNFMAKSALTQLDKI